MVHKIHLAVYPVLSDKRKSIYKTGVWACNHYYVIAKWGYATFYDYKEIGLDGLYNTTDTSKVTCKRCLKHPAFRAAQEKHYEKLEKEQYPLFFLKKHKKKSKRVTKKGKRK